MNVTVNGEARELADGATVADLVAHLSLAPDGIAVAVERTVVPRSRWDTQALDEGASVEVVTAMQGG